MDQERRRHVYHNKPTTTMFSLALKQHLQREGLLPQPQDGNVPQAAPPGLPNMPAGNLPSQHVFMSQPTGGRPQSPAMNQQHYNQQPPQAEYARASIEGEYAQRHQLNPAGPAYSQPPPTPVGGAYPSLHPNMPFLTTPPPYMVQQHFHTASPGPLTMGGAASTVIKEHSTERHSSLVASPNDGTCIDSRERARRTGRSRSRGREREAHPTLLNANQLRENAAPTLQITLADTADAVVIGTVCRVLLKSQGSSTNTAAEACQNRLMKVVATRNVDIDEAEPP